MFFSSLPIAGIRCCLVPPSFPFPVNQKMPMPKKLSSIFKLLGLLLPVLLFLLNIAGEENARNFFASTLIQMQGSLEVFRDLIAKRPTWREIQIHYWHKVDGPVLQKFIIGSKNIRDQLSPEHPLSNFLDDILALRSKLGRVTYTEAEQQNWKWLEAVADKALALFKPKTEPETIACAAPLFGYQAALVKEGSTEYKTIRSLLTVRDFLDTFLTNVRTFSDEQWPKRVKDPLLDPFDAIRLGNNFMEKMERTQKPMGKTELQTGPHKMRYHFWRWLRRLEEFEEKFWDYIHFNHQGMKRFLLEARQTAAAVAERLAKGEAEKADLLAPMDKLADNYLRPSLDKRKQCLGNILDLGRVQWKLLKNGVD